MAEGASGSAARQFVVEADTRGRVSLGRAGKLAERYLCYALADGRIVLQPAAVVSELELDLLRDPDLADRVDDGRRELAEGEVGRRGWTRGDADAAEEPRSKSGTRRREAR